MYSEICSGARASYVSILSDAIHPFKSGAANHTTPPLSLWPQSVGGPPGSSENGRNSHAAEGPPPLLWCLIRSVAAIVDLLQKLYCFVRNTEVAY